MTKRTLIVDTDPGIDDALALLLLYKYKKNFSIKLFCSTAGNIPIETTTNNINNFFTSVPFNLKLVDITVNKNNMINDNPKMSDHL